MNQFEKAVYMACKAFVSAMEGQTHTTAASSPGHPASTASNGAPTCPHHGKLLAKGKYGGYYCQSEEQAPGISRLAKNGKWYCNYTEK